VLPDSGGTAGGFGGGFGGVHVRSSLGVLEPRKAISSSLSLALTGVFDSSRGFSSDILRRGYRLYRFFGRPRVSRRWRPLWWWRPLLWWWSALTNRRSVPIDCSSSRNARHNSQSSTNSISLMPLSLSSKMLISGSLSDSLLSPSQLADSK